MILRIFIAFLLTPFSLMSEIKEKKFVIIIPSYNNKDWYKNNLNSVFNQKYQNYRVIYISDGSTDGTGELVEEFIQQKQLENRCTIIKNKSYNGPLGCMCQGASWCDKDEIIVDLDGNDWLAHPKVLNNLNEIYQDADVWMTYGQFMCYPLFTKGFAKEVPPEIIQGNKFRSFGGAITHLKTFYAGLFHKIDKGDFLWEGKFYPKASDLAYSIPISEMAGRHIRFVPGVLYVFNKSLPPNEHKCPSPLEEDLDRVIRNKEKYSPLNHLPLEELTVPIYSQVSDFLQPTIQDYRLVQDFLSHGKRENIERLKDMQNRVREIKIIGNAPDELPLSGMVPVNCSADDKQNCLLIYSSFNDQYPRGLKRLLKHTVESDFKGHVLYQLGGWPDTEGGSLQLAHVPYAFKVSFFKEAKRLGYKRALWLDAAVMPLVSLNTIFDTIKQNGYFIMGNERMVGPYINSSAAAYFGLTLEETAQIPSCSAGLFGVDFTQKIGNQIIDLWYRAAHDKDAFFSARSDQNALSIIFYQLGISDFVSLDKMPHTPEEIQSDSLFWLDRGYVH